METAGTLQVMGGWAELKKIADPNDAPPPKVQVEPTS